MTPRGRAESTTRPIGRPGTTAEGPDCPDLDGPGFTPTPAVTRTLPDGLLADRRGQGPVRPVLALGGVTVCRRF